MQIITATLQFLRFFRRLLERAGAYLSVAPCWTTDVFGDRTRELVLEDAV